MTTSEKFASIKLRYLDKVLAFLKNSPLNVLSETIASGLEAVVSFGTTKETQIMTQTTFIESLSTDEWFVDSPDLREFVDIAKEIISSTTHNRAQTLKALEPDFAALLKKENWLPKHFAQSNLSSGLGSGIGQWLLYRSQDRTLTIFSLLTLPAINRRGFLVQRDHLN